MLLRRITEHVKAQNWTAVTLDFLIVVIGVFMGLQVQQWSTERSNRLLEHEYLERLLVDVDRSIEQSQAYEVYMLGQKERTSFVLNSLQRCELPVTRRDEFASGIYSIGRFIRASYLLGTMKELQSTGAFSIIRSREIHDLFEELSAAAQADAEIVMPIAARLGPSLAYIDQHVILLRDSGSIIESNSDTGWKDIKIDFDALCNDARFQGATSMSVHVTHIYLDRIERALELLQRTKTALQTELEVTN